MRATNHGETLVQLTRSFLTFPINCYLVREADGLTLIDTGMHGSANSLLTAARRLDMPIVRIALTHAHPDHAGSLDALHASLPDAEVLISAREARLAAGDSSLDPDEPQKSPGWFARPTTRPTRLLQPGDRVGSLEVVAALGHTPGQIALLDARDGTLVAGDAFYTHAGIAVAGTVQWRFPFPGLSTWDRATAIESARRLRDLQPSRLAVGHGATIEHPVPAMDAAIATAERGLAKARRRE
jgi:glyoxylase-like metal-dependent hydrolase (beta-lactamase superfamily II)